MTVMRVERVVYGVPNLDECVRFFEDFGLYPVHDEDAANRPGARFTTQTGQVIELRPVGDPGLPAPVQDGPSLREIVWVSIPRRRSTRWRPIFDVTGRSGPTPRC